MSKKKQKRSKGKSRQQKRVDATKHNKPTPLKEKLARVYSMSDLRTTCAGNCTCCEVAMPTMNYCEFVQLLNDIWDKETIFGKADIVKTSIKYFFKYHYEIWGMDKFIKPCMLLKDGRCSYYNNRPLNCRMYGLWPEEVYTKRVDSFEADNDLKREDIPLNTQCPNVKRLDVEEDLTMEEIQPMYDNLNDLDFKLQRFTSNQIKNGDNIRSFHDWMCYTFFGEEWLLFMTQLILQAKAKDNCREILEDQIDQINIAVDEKYINSLPPLKEITG